MNDFVAILIDDKYLELLLGGLTDKIFWIDKDYNSFSSDEISDIYLKNILYFISEGHGWKNFLTKEKINDIFKEAYKRKLLRPDIIFTLHSLALYYQDYSDKRPKYKVTYEGEYILN